MEKVKLDIEKLIKGGIVSRYKISKDTGISQTTLGNYFSGITDFGRMPLDTAIKLHNYYKEELVKMEMWEFEGYKVFEELDVLRFENNEGDLLGYVMKEDDSLIEELDSGADPIVDGWEDGIGNTININGWENE